MQVIDADTHVDECEETWGYLRGDDAKYAPVTVMPTDGASEGRASAGRGRWWLVDGQLVPRAIRDDGHHPPQAAREMHDVQVRLRDMDRMGVDVQVLFPTFFIRYGSSNPAAEAALCGAYNRWMAERCAPTNGRLRWIAQLPLLDTDRAARELHWAKEHGAVGLYKRGYDLEKPVTDPHFFPVYKAASALDMPVCIHTGHPLPGREWDRGFPLMAAFIGIVGSRLPEKFPQLRFGFIEGGASWVSYGLSQLGMQRRSQALHERAQAFDLTRDLLRDNLMIGTDYGHGDISANRNALDEVQEWVESDRITEAVAHKILETNPKLFYGL